MYKSKYRTQCSLFDFFLKNFGVEIVNLTKIELAAYYTNFGYRKFFMRLFLNKLTPYYYYFNLHTLYKYSILTAGLDTTAKTKEEYMFRRAQDRIRTYYYKTKDELLKNPDLPSERLHILLKELQDLLKDVNYFGSYFDRSKAIGDNKIKSICDEKGVFTCEGRWDKNFCLYVPVHTINPYRSREDRIVFQTWNLDHNIERSRSIIPAICSALKEIEAVNGKKKKQLDVKQIFDDIFTRNNLKLVHIVCHDKGAHDGKAAGPYVI